jgi:hypothetical protein
MAGFVANTVLARTVQLAGLSALTNAVISSVVEGVCGLLLTA